jgi:hypothetical protein
MADDQQVRSARLLDQDPRRLALDLVQLDGDGREIRSVGDEVVDRPPGGRPQLVLQLAHDRGCRHGSAVNCGGTNAETTRTPVPRRAASSSAYRKATREPVDPSTPTTTVCC